MDHQVIKDFWSGKDAEFHGRPLYSIFNQVVYNYFLIKAGFAWLCGGCYMLRAGGHLLR